jgi:hypothetical protein
MSRAQILLEREAIHPSRKPNWPICRPWIHHDIVGEIPEDLQRTVKLGYANWIGN